MATHPFREAWSTRDLDAFAAALSPDVVLHSPVIRAPFSGREAAVELYGVLFEAFGEFEISEEFAAGDAQAFFWQGELQGRQIEGTDLIRLDDQGRIREVRVMIRPLLDIAAFAAAVGPMLAGKRGRVRGLVVRLMTLPLKGILTVADAVATRLILHR